MIYGPERKKTFNGKLVYTNPVCLIKEKKCLISQKKTHLILQVVSDTYNNFKRGSLLNISLYNTIAKRSSLSEFQLL